MGYNSGELDKLLEKLDIVELVGEVVDLKKAGANYKGLCPFHKDTNPSFMVSPTKQISKCFVCGAGGTPLKFYMNFHKLSFEEAVKELSARYNVPLTYYSSKKKNNQHDRYYEIMKEASDFYSERIFSNRGREAVEYMLSRGLKVEFIKDNKIGYAESSWESLYKHLLSKGYTEKEMVTLGLIKEGERGYYDNFRNRVMYPIYTPDNKIIAFSGRTLIDDKKIPKYINSPETPIFRKGEILYGIKDKGANIRKKNYSIIMEGQMDVLAASFYGFDTAVAPLGTAFTKEQATLLKRYTDNVIICPDMDAPGMEAAAKNSIILKREGFNIRVTSFENAKDADEFLRKFGRKAFLNVVKESKEIFDFLYDYYLREYDISNFIAKQNFIDRFKEFFRACQNDLEKSLYLDKLSKSLSLEKELLEKVLVKDNKEDIKPRARRPQVKKEKYIEIEDSLEIDSLRLIDKEKSLYSVFKDKSYRDPFIIKIFSYLEGENIGDFVKELMEISYLEEDEKNALFNIHTSIIQDGEYKQTLIATYLGWFMREIKERMNFYKGSNFKAFFECKKIFDDLKNNHYSFDELEVKYEKFKKID